MGAIVCHRWRSPRDYRWQLPRCTRWLLVRCRLNRLSHIDIRTGEVIRCYEHDHPGALLHVDVKKLGNIPAGGGWRFRRSRPGHQEPRGDSRGQAQPPDTTPTFGHAFVHTVIDDHSRVAYAEIHDDDDRPNGHRGCCARSVVVPGSRRQRRTRAV